MKTIKTLLAGCVLATLGMAAAPALAWPDKPVTLVVPYPAGGGVDPVARLVGQKLAERWKQPVIVSNRPGASGSIGAAYVARAQPDGATIMMSAASEVAINQFFMPQLQYDAAKDLAPVTLVLRLPFILAASTTMPYSTVEELVDYARKNPGKVSYASSGVGSAQHLAGALLEQVAGVQMNHVPYKGVAPATSDLLAHQVDIGFVGMPTGLPHVRDGKLKGLAVSSAQASPAAPDIPPVAATSGLEKFELTQWFGVFMPAGTPADIIAQVQRDMAAVLAMPDVSRTLRDQGAEPSGMSTEEFKAFLDSERGKFGRIAKTMGVRP